METHESQIINVVCTTITKFGQVHVLGRTYPSVHPVTDFHQSAKVVRLLRKIVVAHVARN